VLTSEYNSDRQPEIAMDTTSDTGNI